MNFIRDKVVKANKDYVCDLCLNDIVKGSKHRSVTFADGGKIISWREHTHCSELAEKLRMYDAYDELDSDTFLTAIYEFLYEKLGNDVDEVTDNVDTACELLEIRKGIE